MDEIETQNHPDAVCSMRDLPCRVLGEVLIERDALREKLDDCLESLRLIEKVTRPDGDMADAAVNLLIRSCRWKTYDAHDGVHDVDAALSILLGRMRLLGQDHGPDDWPAVQMRDITALCDALAAVREGR